LLLDDLLVDGAGPQPDTHTPFMFCAGVGKARTIVSATAQQHRISRLFLRVFSKAVEMAAG